MPIPEITRTDVLAALRRIDREGVPASRRSTKFSIRYDGNLYPPKYAISLAVAEATGGELSPSDFSGGRESNSLLESLGFEVIQTGEWDTRSRPKREYRRPDENPGTKPTDPFVRDPDKTERGLRVHAKTQNALHDFLAEHGLESWSPDPGDPAYDLGWRDGERLCVAEIKSLPEGGESKQLRLGLGQVLDYQDDLGAHLAVLAVERRPPDRWVRLCKRVGVLLVWPGVFERVIEAGE